MRQRTMWFLLAAVGAGCSSDPTPVGNVDDDAGFPEDLGFVDVGTDSGRRDVPVTDNGQRADTGAADAGATDAGAADTGLTDAGVTDAGAPDTGLTDAGATDTGMTGIDAGPPASTLAAVRASITSTTATTLNAALSDLVVTEVVAPTPGTDGGVAPNDPGGFFVQSAMTGPAVFVAADPAHPLSPAPQPGDRVSFTATQGALHAGAHWITAITDFQRNVAGVDLTTLQQDLSSSADIITGLADYELELVRVQGTVAVAFATAGTGFESAQITTAGVTAANTNLRLRVAAALRASLGLRAGCTFTVTSPLWRFNSQVQVHAWTASDITVGTCPALDAGTPDAGTPDAGTPDAGFDAGTPDVGFDAGTPDVGFDAGTVDDVGTDTGPADTGTDTGPADTGPADTGAADAGPAPTPTEVWVLRVGDGTGALSSSAAALFLDRMPIGAPSTTGTSITLPVATVGANRSIVLSGSSTSEGQISRSVDGRYVVVAGYASTPGTASVAGTTAASTPRVVARVAADGSIDTTTTLGSAFNSSNARGAASLDGSSFWAAGTGGSAGIVSAALGASTSTAVVTSTTNVRTVALYDGDVFGTAGASSLFGVFHVSGTTATILSGFPTSTSSPYQFVAFDRDATAGIDLIYLCDDRATASGGGVQKWTLGGTGTWTLAGTMAMGLTGGCRGLAGFASGTSITLIATTSETVSRVVRFVDDGSTLASIPATALRSAATNTVFRGVALAPR